MIWTEDEIERNSIDELFNSSVPEFLHEKRTHDNNIFYNEADTAPDTKKETLHLISLEQYLAFNAIVNKIDDIELAIELYTCGMCPLLF